jgi:Ribonuclease G/E
MAGGELPTAKQRRDMLAQDSPELGAASRAYAQAGRWGEALECLDAAEDREGLAQAAAEAAENGDLFIYRRAKQLLGEDLAPRDLARLAEAAESAGKLSHATSARKILHQEES